MIATPYRHLGLILFSCVLVWGASGARGQGYALDLMALAGPGLPLTSLDAYVSINNRGTVAFTGRDSINDSKGFVASRPGQPVAVTLFGGGREFRGAAINNEVPAQAAFRERLTSSYLVRKWPEASGLGSTTIARSFTLFGCPPTFDAGVPFVDINDSGVVCLTGLTIGSGSIGVWAGTTCPPVLLGTYPITATIRPLISDTGRVVLKNQSEQIVLLSYPAGPTDTVASALDGFLAGTLGGLPGLSPDGTVVAFIGDRGLGEGLFLSVATSNGRRIIHVAGEGADAFTGFDQNQRCGVMAAGAIQATPLGGGQTVQVVFGATSSATGTGVFRSVLTVQEDPQTGVVSNSFPATTWVARNGGQVGGKTMASFFLYDPINANGTAAFQATFTDGTWGVIRAGGDADEDGLLDRWESPVSLGGGIDANHDGTIDLDLHALGARPDHKDLFVEVDAMAGMEPSTADLDAVRAAFANAPVPNLDLVPGIRLCLHLDETGLILAPWPLAWADFDTFKAARFGTVLQRSDSNAQHILEAKRLAFRYGVFASDYAGTDWSGLAEYPGNDFMVTLGLWSPLGGTPAQKRGTFMHELGHTLGLGHGGIDSINCKPNYYSVMNYIWQFPRENWAGFWRLDYSRATLPVLDEQLLFESVGLGGDPTVRFPVTSSQVSIAGLSLPVYPLQPMGGAVDWNGDHDTNDFFGPPGLDVNNYWFCGTPPAIQIMLGHSDWENLTFNIRGSPDFAEGSHATSAGLQELSLSAVQLVNPLGPCADGNVGAGTGGPIDVLRINGGRWVVVAGAFQSLTVTLDQPAANPAPAPSVIFGLAGLPAPAQAAALPFGIGTMCFTPCWFDPANPTLFTLWNSVLSGTPCPALVPAAPGAVTLPVPTGLPAGVQVTLQGVIEESPGVFRVTNAVALVVT